MGTDETSVSLDTVLNKRYRIIEEIGKGGFGRIYRATQMAMDRDVAVKVLPPKFSTMPDVVERFKREAKLASQLQHPHTVTVHDYGTQQDLLFIVLEYLKGMDLADSLNETSIPPVAETVSIGCQILQSLREAHSTDIVHRDLKPENVFLAEVGHQKNFVKVLDFGIAKITAPEPAPDDSEDDPSWRKLTKDGSTVGTPSYMAPEQAAGGDIDPQTDLYSVGIILYEMANGHPPYDAEEPSEIMRKQLFEEVPRFTNDKLKNSPLESIVLKAISKNKEDRYESASAFLDALRSSYPANADSSSADSSSNKTGGSLNTAPAKKGSVSSGTKNLLATPVDNLDISLSDRTGDLETASKQDQTESDRHSDTGEPDSSAILTVVEPSEEQNIIVLDNPKEAKNRDRASERVRQIESVEANRRYWLWGTLTVAILVAIALALL